MTKQLSKGYEKAILNVDIKIEILVKCCLQILNIFKNRTIDCVKFYLQKIKVAKILWADYIIVMRKISRIVIYQARKMVIVYLL